MSFIESYIDLLIENSAIPKFQSERAISSLIELYISKIIRFLTKKEYEFITIELPLPIDGTNQSTNIDYMLYNKNENCVLVVELKTERQGNDHHLVQQLINYQVFKNDKEISLKILGICDNKKRKRAHLKKYENQKNRIKKILKSNPEWQIMYICPDYMINNDLIKMETSHIDYKIGFSQLLEIEIDNEWDVVKKYLRHLNSNPIFV